MMIPDEVPAFRFCQAKERGVLNNIMIETWGGLGDLATAEPAIRFAIKEFKGIDISVATWGFPEIFAHLGLKQVIDTSKNSYEKSDYYNFKSFNQVESLSGQFIRYPLMQRVDYASMALWGRTLPNSDKNLTFEPSSQDHEVACHLLEDHYLVIHPGRTWASRTMPKDWWDEIIESLGNEGIRPILVGSEFSDGVRGTVDVTTAGCLDLRGKMSIMESIALLQNAKVVLTNDSAPLHFAASGTAHIGFLATANHPDHITHWRKTDQGNVEWAWRMHNFAKSGMWELMPLLPNEDRVLSLGDVDETIMRSWLPKPLDVVNWTLEKL